MEPIRIILEVFVESDELDHVGTELGKLPEVVYLYEVTGGPDIVALIRTDSISAFRDLLVHKILHIRGVRHHVCRYSSSKQRTLVALSLELVAESGYGLVAYWLLNHLGMEGK